MATISNIQDLLPLLGSVATAADPIAALEQRGQVLSPALKARLKPQRTPTPAQRQLWNKAAAKAGKLRFTTGQKPRIAPARALQPGEFEFSAGVKTATANEILAGLFASGTIPDTIFLDELLSSDLIVALGGLFQVDRPGGRISRMQITAAPTVATIRDGFDRVTLTIPFRLNFERVLQLATGQIRTVVTFATGRLTLSVGLVASVPPALPRNLEIQIDLSQADDAQLTLDASSPVQLTSPGNSHGAAILIQNAMQARLADTLHLSISASIPVPIGKLAINKTAIVTRGDAVLVGIKVQGVGGTGDPAKLTAQFPNAQTNFFTRVHDSVLRQIIQSAARSGELTNIAKQTHPDAVIDSADVSFGNGTINFIATGKIVDLCPLGVDLGFTVTVTITLTLDGTRILVKKETSKDLDNLDAFLCIITSLGLALLAAIAVIVFQGLSIASGIAATAAFGVIGVLSLILEFNGDDFALVFGDGSDGQPAPIELDFPIPGTDLLPTLNGLFIRLDESTMLMAAHLGTRADVLNTYFYVRFLEANSVGSAQAMKGVTVRLMDRDSPAPAGDDVTLPGPSTTTTSHRTPAGVIVTTTKTHFERTADETFSQAAADHTGRVRFYIPRNRLASKAGNKVVETTRSNLDKDLDTTGTRRTAVPEARPDFYFRVTRANGTVIDTLQLPAGFFLNFQSARVGTPANPLTITFGGGRAVVLDPGN